MYYCYIVDKKKVSIPICGQVQGPYDGHESTPAVPTFTDKAWYQPNTVKGCEIEKFVETDICKVQCIGHFVTFCCARWYPARSFFVEFVYYASCAMLFYEGLLLGVVERWQDAGQRC